jgi:hypothetical protein
MCSNSCSHSIKVPDEVFVAGKFCSYLGCVQYVALIYCDCKVLLEPPRSDKSLRRFVPVNEPFLMERKFTTCNLDQMSLQHMSSENDMHPATVGRLAQYGVN